MGQRYLCYTLQVRSTVWTCGCEERHEMESAQAKNQALRDAGATVPTSYEAFEGAIKEAFEKLVVSLDIEHTNDNSSTCWFDLADLHLLCADHGPCVSGAHNSIVTARAGKDLGLTPYEFVESMKKKGIRVPGIGHRIKRGDNRDKRVELLQLYARENFPSVKYMEYAVQPEIDEIVDIGYLNGLFVLARSIGLIGHTFDQKRLKQPLYRHPWEDVLYTK
ncbi:ATP-citrate synthase beta chain protein [Datura stramonium]|uniref:ATP-citrate synthase beta chain protein n=1 Tax=Datura stramonium TaxID=4076 RepID=A0ABS8SYW6_DATST|nr:ATP-citrate synthase beta chain protein [Datura stramonium]